MIKVFTFGNNVLLDPGSSLCFIAPYLAKMFEVLPEKLFEPFCVSTLVGMYILVESVYHDYPISINNKNTMANLVELDMVYFCLSSYG